MSIADIKEHIARLPAKERAALARWILASLDEAVEDENAVDLAWRQEVRARVDAIKAGKVQMIPSEDVWRDLLSMYGMGASPISGEGIAAGRSVPLGPFGVQPLG